VKLSRRTTWKFTVKQSIFKKSICNSAAATTCDDRSIVGSETAPHPSHTSAPRQRNRQPVHLGRELARHGAQVPDRREHHRFALLGRHATLLLERRPFSRLEAADLRDTVEQAAPCARPVWFCGQATHYLAKSPTCRTAQTRSASQIATSITRPHRVIGLRLIDPTRNLRPACHPTRLWLAGGRINYASALT
jgi:hypothetical protein